MNTFLRALSLSLLLLTPLPLLAISFPDQTAADADIVVSIRDIKELREKLVSHPFGKLGANPKRDFFGDLVSTRFGFDGKTAWSEFEETLDNEFGLNFDELVELFPGRLSLSFYGVTDSLIRENNCVEFVLMADYCGSEEELDELLKIQFERNAEAHKELLADVEHELIEENFMGEKLFFDKVFDGESTYIEDGYALVEGIWILATPADRLRSAVEAVKRMDVATISGLDAYAALSEQADAGDLSFMVHLETLVEPIGPLLHDVVGKSGLAMAGVTGQSLEAALALDDLGAYGLELHLKERGLRADSGLVYREKSGLMTLAAYEGGALPEANYVPSGVFSSSVVHFDMSEMLANLESLLKVASPALAPMLDIQLQNLRSSTGVDLRNAILENFGSEVVTFNLLPQQPDAAEDIFLQEQFLAIEVIDSQAISQAFEALLDSTPYAREAFETKDFEGEKVYTVRASASGAAEEVSFVITRSHLIVHQGSVAVLQEVISAMQGGREGFWGLERTRELFDQLDVDEPVGRYYADLGQMIRPMMSPVLEALSIGGFSVPEGETLPDDSDFPFVAISESYELPDGFFTKMLIVLNEED